MQPPEAAASSSPEAGRQPAASERPPGADARAAPEPPARSAAGVPTDPAPAPRRARWPRVPRANPERAPRRAQGAPEAHGDTRARRHREARSTGPAPATRGARRPEPDQPRTPAARTSRPQPEADPRPREAQRTPDRPPPAPRSPARPATSPGSADAAEMAGGVCEASGPSSASPCDEPLLPARVHRPSDLLRLLTGVLAIAVVLAIAAFAHGTTSGLEDDITKGTDRHPRRPDPPRGSRLQHRRPGPARRLRHRAADQTGRAADRRRRAGRGARARRGARHRPVGRQVRARLDHRGADPAVRRPARLTDPVHGYLAPVIAYMTAVGMARRPRWRVALWAVLLLNSFAVLVGGQTTPFSIIVTILIGWTVAYGTLYAVGSPNVRPTGQTLLAGPAPRRLQPGDGAARRGRTGLAGAGRARPALSGHAGGRPAARRHGRRPRAAGAGLLLPGVAPSDAAFHHHPPLHPVAAAGPGAGGAARVRGDRGRGERAQADRHLRARPGRRDAGVRAHRRPLPGLAGGQGDHRRAAARDLAAGARRCSPGGSRTAGWPATRSWWIVPAG